MTPAHLIQPEFSNHCLVRSQVVGMPRSAKPESEDLKDECVIPFVAIPAAHWILEKKQPCYILAAKAACAKIEPSANSAKNGHKWLQA
jgi:hypothetical protein